ncbi:hypothetical protein [Chitinophaga sancti]|uniref:Uncharacterized protein n=1 Tax=Chitinophaga sancti TaxID=1004 RepID=A0A1K1RQC2_9BACT|nr:hypothetical protein [Chitinophaga sancti]WQD62484.1 hypothetical protein U0033_31830 [Chitinophaga sancti]WQG91947.1 hypothetical protein SR876_10555 [Chitinophaga sancti]SFW74352.1 hypothetical protein SAMN05661012_04148 [Chitinophaga sancti]
MWTTIRLFFRLVIWKNFKGVFLFFIILFAMITTMKTYGGWINQRHFKKFNESNIRGTLSYVRGSGTGTGIDIGYVYKYVFLPDAHLWFERTAEIGDSVIKPAFSDTLILKKGNKIYPFTFRKYPNDK